MTVVRVYSGHLWRARGRPTTADTICHQIRAATFYRDTFYLKERDTASVDEL